MSFSSVEIIYLYHSGFVVKTESSILVFDYYQDPQNKTANLIHKGESTWVFCSHRHADHFNKNIAAWNNHVAAYFLSEDIRLDGGLDGVDKEKISYMQPYEMRQCGSLHVSTYGSTDEGVSFLVDIDGVRIFHAGDLNWWHWREDTVENQQLAAEVFYKEMHLLAGLRVDVAFFPVDSRLEEYRAIGVEEFCRNVHVKQLIAMHTCGQPWIPSADFTAQHPAMSVWCPKRAGEQMNFHVK